MEILTTTPFGQRPVTAALVERARQARAEASIHRIDKWQLFRELCAAKDAYGVRDRDLTVLNALLSFHPETALSDNDALIVFPSNAALSERAHGMAESTLRRHLAALVNSGLIQRHDSPNGKRYATRDADGNIGRAFGFDLRPLLVHAAEIISQADEARAFTAHCKRLREAISLMKRDAVKMVIYGQENGLKGNWDELSDRCRLLARGLRRKLPLEALEVLEREIRELLVDIQALIMPNTEEMSGNDSLNGRHYHNSNPKPYDSEHAEKPAGRGAEVAQNPEGGSGGNVGAVEPPGPVVVPLPLVLKACPDLLPYMQDDIRHWHELVAGAAMVRGMMGISADAWDQACRSMGAENAAVTVACILQRVSQISSPGGYLRALARKSEDGQFSPGPMVMSLLNSDRRAA